jgi:site-specific DNA recombinase
MVGNPNHGRLHYRCTASRDFVRQHQISHPPALYLREDQITAPVDRFLREELTGTALTDNVRRVAEAQYRAALAAHDTAGEIQQLRQAISDADAKISRYRATLDTGGDPALIADWISETTTIKKAAQARLGLTGAPPQRMSAGQIDAIAEAFDDLFRLLRDADPRDKAELYSRIGLRMAYRPGPETLIAEVSTPASSRVFDWCPMIDTNEYHMRRFCCTWGNGSCPEGDLNPHA